MASRGCSRQARATSTGSTWAIHDQQRSAGRRGCPSPVMPTRTPGRRHDRGDAAVAGRAPRRGVAHAVDVVLVVAECRLTTFTRPAGPATCSAATSRSGARCGADQRQGPSEDIRQMASSSANRSAGLPPPRRTAARSRSWPSVAVLDHRPVDPPSSVRRHPGRSRHAHRGGSRPTRSCACSWSRSSCTGLGRMVIQRVAAAEGQSLAGADHDDRPRPPPPGGPGPDLRGRSLLQGHLRLDPLHPSGMRSWAPNFRHLNFTTAGANVRQIINDGSVSISTGIVMAIVGVERTGHVPGVQLVVVHRGRSSSTAPSASPSAGPTTVATP